MGIVEGWGPARSQECCRVAYLLYTKTVNAILGRKITSLQDGLQPAGYHQAIWHADDNSSSMYFYKIQAGDYTETKKMVLLK